MDARAARDPGVAASDARARQTPASPSSPSSGAHENMIVHAQLVRDALSVVGIGVREVRQLAALDLGAGLAQRPRDARREAVAMAVVKQPVEITRLREIILTRGIEPVGDGRSNLPRGIAVRGI